MHIKREVHTYEHPIPTADLSKFDQRKGATWHCIVGRNFGSFVTHGMASFAQGP